MNNVRKKIVMLDRFAFPSSFDLSDLDNTLELHNLEWHRFNSTSSEEAIPNLKNAEIAILSKIKIDNEILAASPKLKHIAVGATGFNCISIDACQKHGVSVSHVPNYAATTIAEHVIACALTLRRKVLSHRERVIAGEWQTANNFCLFDPPFSNLRNATLGIIGLGAIGLRTAELASALGVNVIFTSRSPKRYGAKQVGLEYLLKESDIISVHCDLNDSTHNLIDEPEINLMHPGTVLINTARGGIVNETAVAKAISSNHLSGIAFDVLTEEPPKSSSPLLSLVTRPNVIITPHSAWTSEQALTQLKQTLILNIKKFLAGEPQNLVT